MYAHQSRDSILFCPSALPSFASTSVISRILVCIFTSSSSTHRREECEFQKYVRMGTGQNGDFAQKRMRIHTRVDANGFRIYRRRCERFFRWRWASARLTVQWAGKRLGWTDVEVRCRYELTLKWLSFSSLNFTHIEKPLFACSRSPSTGTQCR
jgi:hypothetical protein